MLKLNLLLKESRRKWKSRGIKGYEVYPKRKLLSAVDEWESVGCGNKFNNAGRKKIEKNLIH